MATSPKQIAANRRNASKATGPRSPEGKAASRGNAVKHGALSKVVVAKGEIAGAFEALYDGLQLQFKPETALEEQLVKKLAMAFWRDRRLAVAEKVLIEVQTIEYQRRDKGAFDVGGSPYFILRKNGVPELNDLTLLGRYQVMVTNEIQRTLAMLRNEQALREQTIDVTPVEQDDT